MKHPKHMTAGEINRELDRLDREDSRITSELIAAGRGHETPRVRQHLDDPLSVAWRETQDRASCLRVEIWERCGRRLHRMPRGLKRSLTALALAATLTAPALADTAGWAAPDSAPDAVRGVTLCTETINLNAATPEQLQLLYRVGPVLAQRIVEGRPYELPSDLVTVPGVGPATLGANWLWIATTGETTLQVPVPAPEPETEGDLLEWVELPGCPDQGQGLCEPAQDPEDGTVAWDCH